MVKNIISFGGGQNSTALIIEMYNRGMPIDAVIFAETGNEMPETYIFLQEFQLWLEQRKIPFIEVQSKLGDLKSYYMSKNLIPIRLYRHCTHKFKVIPINDWIKDNYGIDEPINMFIGIGSDEQHRARLKGRKQFTYVYPLIEWNIDRKKCQKIISKEGLTVPIKSGCYFCPFQSKKSWKKLYKDHPGLYDKSIDFEKNCSRYPDFTLIGTETLEDFKTKLKEQTTLFEDTDEGCFFCFA